MTNLPSWPAKGESLTLKIMLRVGSSTSMRGRASGFSMSAMVSPMSTSSMPTTAQMSPASACGCLAPAEAFKEIEVDDLVFFDFAVAFEEGDLLVFVDDAVEDAADADTADVFVVINVGDLHLQGFFEVGDGAFDLGDDGFEEGRMSMPVSAGSRRA